MMDSMRNAAKGWVAKVLIGLLAVSFGVWGIADVFRGFNSGSLAKVGNVDVSAEEYSRAFTEALSNLARQTGQQLTQDEARNLGIDRAVLNNLIQSAAIDNHAQDLSLAVSDAYLATATRENPNFQNSAGEFDRDAFQRLLAANGMNEAVYFSQFRQDLRRQAVTGTATDDLPVPQTLVKARYRYQNEQRDARYFIVRTEDSEVPAPTDEDIRTEYEAHPVAYTAPEYRSIAMMKAEPSDIANKITLTDDEIATGYDRYKGDYSTPETRTVLQLSLPTLDDAKAARDRIMAGEDFLAVAKEKGFSESDVTFANKSRADFFDSAIAEAAFSLAEGAVSDPIKGALATAVLKVVKITPAHQSTLDEIKDKLVERLKLDRARDEIRAIYDAVEDARAAQTKFEDIAAAESIPFQLVAATDISGRDKAGKLVDVAFLSEVLKPAFESDVGVENREIALDDGYVWYEVREVVPAAVKPLEEVKDQARRAVLAEKVRALTEEKARKLVERADGGARLEDLAAETQAEIKTAQGLRRNESSGDFGREAVGAIFAVPEGSFALALEPDGRSAKVMQSQAVLLQTFDPASAEAKSISDQLKAAEAGDMLFAFLGALQKDAGVSINETLWRQISGLSTQ